MLGQLELPAELDIPVRIGGVLLATAVGVLSYLTLERPLDRLLRRRNAQPKPRISSDIPLAASGFRSSRALED
jgi:peptidoglycan/LPS O-acetylase OafA/YrhL